MKTKIKKFKALTPAQKRVAIAKDVLAQIKAQKYKVQTGAFCYIAGSIPTEIGQKALLRIKPKCTVCAIGAAIVSGIRLFNKIKIEDGEIGNRESWEFIREWFEPEQAILIENAFERGKGDYQCENYDDMPEVSITDAETFGCEVEDDTDRAVAIFENIIKNKGTFKP